MRFSLLSSRPAIPEPVGAGIEKTSQLASQLADEARDVALPKIEAAREQAVTAVKERVLPRVSKTLTEAEALSKPARKEAKKRGEAAIAALRGDAPSRRRRWPRAILLMGAGAVAGAAAGLMAGRKESASPGLDAYSPIGGTDPYARTEPTSTSGTTGTATTSTTTTPTTDTTIDVTDEPAVVNSDGETAKAKPAAARKPRGTQS